MTCSPSCPLSYYLALLSLITVLATVIATTSPETSGVSINPFVLSRQQSDECRTIRMPPSLCRACPMLPFTGGGNFERGQYDMYDLTTPQCKGQINQYLKLNPCDKDTAKAVQNNHRSDIAYFLYSICEQCCDCIPIGAKKEQYANRKNNNRLLSIRRGNCAAHFHYDVCRIWSKYEHLTWGEGKEVRRAEVCPQFRNWIFSDDASNWLQNPKAKGLTKDMRRAMWALLARTQCTNKRVWTDCTRLERAQNRV